MSERAPAWVVPVMRAGYAGRALVYAIVGSFAVLAAWTGHEAEGTSDALKSLRAEPLGLIALGVIAVGLFAYAAWRAIDAWLDLDAHGHDAKGIVARLALAVAALINVALAAYAVGLLVGARIVEGGGNGGGGKGLTAQIMHAPWGRWLVAAAGLCVLGAAVQHFRKGWKRTYRDHIRLTETTERLDPLLRLGMAARGVVLALTGGFIVYAAWTYDPSQAGGMSQAFDTLRSAPFGWVLLGLVALGLVCFALYCAVSAIWRIVPRRSGDDISTLARRAEASIRAAGRDAGRRVDAATR